MGCSNADYTRAHENHSSTTSLVPLLVIIWLLDVAKKKKNWSPDPVLNQNIEQCLIPRASCSK